MESSEKSRHELNAIEAQIVEIVGEDLECFPFSDLDKSDKEKVKRLLSERCAILNSMFRPTEANIAQLRKVNDELYRLSAVLNERVKRMAAKKPMLLDSPEFDDDYELEGTLKFVFNDEDSVCKLPDDAEYGSNFPLMIKTLYEVYNDSTLNSIVSANEHRGPLDDGESWNEPPFMGYPEFDDIIICYAVHDLTIHKYYSIPDLLRLNDFWSEVTFKAQSITNQSGEHYDFDQQQFVKKC